MSVQTTSGRTINDIRTGVDRELRRLTALLADRGMSRVARPIESWEEIQTSLGSLAFWSAEIDDLIDRVKEVEGS